MTNTTLQPETAPCFGDDISWHIPEIGQSLGIGRDADGAVLTEPSQIPDAVLMFNGGVRPLDGSGVVPSQPANDTRLSADDIATLVPAREGKLAAFRETHMTAMAVHLWQHRAHDLRRIVVSSHGFGMSGYLELCKGQAAYANMIDAVARHAALCRDAGLRPVVPFLTCVHGESDRACDRDTYRGYMQDLLADARADIMALTGQDHAPFLVLTQAGVPFQGRVTDVALAQLDLGLSGPDFVCIGPKYQWSFSDNLHLRSNSYRRMGEMMAKFAADRLEGRPAQPLHLCAIDRQGPDQLRLRFHVPSGSLQITPHPDVVDPAFCGIQVIRMTRGPALVRMRSVTRVAPDTLLVVLGDSVQNDDIEVHIAQRATGQRLLAGAQRALIYDEEAGTGAVTGQPLTNWCAHCGLASPAGSSEG